jgi:hypothetical protein
MKLTQIEKLALSIDDPLIFKYYTSLKELDLKVYQVLDVSEYHFVIDGLLELLRNNTVNKKKARDNPKIDFNFLF